MKYLLFALLLALAASAVAKGETYGAPVIVDGTPEEEPTATPGPENPRCARVMTADGPMGFLWKAKSDIGGKLTVIFPTEFRKPFARVEVRRIWNYRKGKLVYRKKPIMDRCAIGGFGNGDRLHARCPYPGSYYDGRVIASDEQQVCEWQVPCPSMRQD